MLQKFHNLAGSWVIKALFSVLLVAFVIFGIGDVLSNRATDDIVVDVGSIHISRDQLEKAFKDQLLSFSRSVGSPIDPAVAKKMGLMDETLKSLIDQALHYQAAAKADIAIGQPQILEMIQKQDFFKDKDGHFDRNRFKQVLAGAGYSESVYVNLLKRDLSSAVLTESQFADLPAPQILVDAVYREQNERRRGETLQLLNAQVKVPAPSDEQVNDYYNNHQSAFTAPEYREFSYIVLSVPDIAKTISVTPEEVRETYDSHPTEYQVPERRSLVQIVVQDQAQAEALATAAQNGKSLDVAAKDANSKEKSADLGLMAKQDLPKELQEPIFAAAPSSIVGPVHTSLGWHVIAVKKIEASHPVKFEDVSAAIAADLKGEHAQDQLLEQEKKIDDQLAGGAKLGEVAAQFNVKLQTAGPLNAKGQKPDGATVDPKDLPGDIVRKAFSQSSDSAAQMAELKNGNAYAVEVTKVTPAGVKPFADVKQDAREAALASAKSEAATAKANALVEKIKAGTSLAKAAKELDLTPIAFGPFKRTAKDKAADPETLSALFDLKSVNEVVVVPAPNGPILVQLSEIIPASAPAASDLDALQKSISGQLKSDLRTQYDLALQKEFPVKRHEKVLGPMRGDP